MSDKITRIRDYCDECGGEGDVSGCCSAEVDENRCVSCGRFCQSEPCHNCEGMGHVEFNVGDEVDIFVCGWSEMYLREQLHEPKDIEDTKTFTGKILEFPSRWDSIVKVGKKKVNIKIEDLSVR